MVVRCDLNIWQPGLTALPVLRCWVSSARMERHVAGRCLKNPNSGRMTLDYKLKRLAARRVLTEEISFAKLIKSLQPSQRKSLNVYAQKLSRHRPGHVELTTAELMTLLEPAQRQLVTRLAHRLADENEISFRNEAVVTEQTPAAQTPYLWRLLKQGGLCNGK